MREEGATPAFFASACVLCWWKSQWHSISRTLVCVCVCVSPVVRECVREALYGGGGESVESSYECVINPSWRLFLQQPAVRATFFYLLLSDLSGNSVTCDIHGLHRPTLHRQP